jgi:hypothetical protein
MKLSLIRSKPFIIIVVLTILFSMTLNGVSAKGITKAETVTQNGYEIEILDKTDKYEKIKFTNISTGKVEYLESKLKNGKYEYYATIDGEKQKIKTKNDNEKKTKDKNKLEDSNGDITIQASWIYLYSTEGSSSLRVATISVIAGILASIYGGTVTGVITSAATYLASINAEEVWYRIGRYQEKDSRGCHIQDVTVFYEYPDYTNYIATEFVEFNVCN